MFAAVFAIILLIGCDAIVNDRQDNLTLNTCRSQRNFYRDHWIALDEEQGPTELYRDFSAAADDMQLARVGGASMCRLRTEELDRSAYSQFATRDCEKMKAKSPRPSWIDSGDIQMSLFFEDHPEARR